MHARIYEKCKKYYNDSDADTTKVENVKDASQCNNNKKVDNWPVTQWRRSSEKFCIFLIRKHIYFECRPIFA